MNFTKSILAKILVHFPVSVIRLRYLLRFKRLPNLKDPRNLNEKILYQKLYTDTSAWSMLADKVQVREYIKKCGLENTLTKLYAVWDDAADIQFENLPDAFMLKSNNGAGKGTNIAIHDKNLLTEADIRALKDKASGWLKQKNIGALSAEPHYRNIKPLVFAEELLPIPKGEKSIVDYKLWCFNGEPYVFIVISNRKSGGEAEFSCYDLNWSNRSDLMATTKHYCLRKTELPRPKNLEKMVEYARILAKPFPQVRVDLYDIDGRIYFGELTFTSLGGMMNYFTPPALLDMGQKIDLNYKG